MTNDPIIQPVTDRIEWELFLQSHPEANFLQSWEWGSFHEKLGHPIERTGWYRNEKLVGVMLTVVEQAKRGTYLTVPAGPIINWNDTEVANSLVDTLTTIAKKYHCVFVRIRPQVEETEETIKLFKNWGFVTAPMYLHAERTLQIDTTLSEEELLQNMRKNTRYEVNKAIKIGLTVSTSTSPDDIDIFYNLQLQTAGRQGFVPFSKNFLREQFTVFANAGKALLYSAWHEGILLAQAFIIFSGQEAVYHYGASTDDGRKYPGAYLIQWEVMKEAKRRGMTRYNLWGIAGEDQKDHRFYNLSVFKRGFGGREVVYLHAHDLVVDPMKYALSWSIEQVRRIKRSV